MTIQILLGIFVLLVLARVVWRYIRHDIRGRELVWWGLFWLAVLAAVAAPQTTDVMAQWVGVARGADLLVYVSVLVLFYIVFRLLIHIERIERDITILSRAVALHHPDLSGVAADKTEVKQ